MTIREKMELGGGNLSWCKPLIGKRVAVALNHGEVVGLRLDGVDVDIGAAAIKRAAMAENALYEEYSGWDDTHILLDSQDEHGSTMEECGCRSCPWFDICDAMDGEEEE